MGTGRSRGRRKPRGGRGVPRGRRLVSGEEREKRQGNADAGSCPLLGVRSASGRETREKRYAAFRGRGKTCRALHPAGFFIRSLPSRLSLSAPAFHRFCPVQRRTGLAGCRSWESTAGGDLHPALRTPRIVRTPPRPVKAGQTGRDDAQNGRRGRLFWPADLAAPERPTRAPSLLPPWRGWQPAPGRARCRSWWRG